MLDFLTENVSGEVVEETLTAAEKVIEFFDKPWVQATCWIGGAIVVAALGYEFVVKRLIRKLKK